MDADSRISDFTETDLEDSTTASIASGFSDELYARVPFDPNRADYLRHIFFSRGPPSASEDGSELGDPHFDPSSLIAACSDSSGLDLQSLDLNPELRAKMLQASAHFLSSQATSTPSSSSTGAHGGRVMRRTRGVGGPGTVRREKAMGNCVVCGEMASLHRYFGSPERTQCKTCSAYFGYEVSRCAQAGEDPVDVARSGKKKERLLRCLQAGMDATLVKVRLPKTAQQRMQQQQQQQQQQHSLPVPVTTATTTTTTTTTASTSSSSSSFHTLPVQELPVKFCAIRRVKDSVCNILEIGEHIAIGDNLDLLVSIEPRLFITFPNGDSLNPSNERLEWSTITFCPPVPVSLLDQLREGKHITARVSCTGQPSHVDQVALTYFQAVNEFLLMEACPGYLNIQSIVESAATDAGLRACIQRVLPIKAMCSKPGPVLTEAEACRIVSDWCDRLEIIMGLADPQQVHQLFGGELAFVSQLQHYLQCQECEGSSTGFTLVHIAAIMNWSSVLATVLRRRDKWLGQDMVRIRFPNLLLSIDPASRDRKSWTPLMWAHVCNNAASVQALEPYAITSSLGDLESITDASTRPEDQTATGTMDHARSSMMSLRSPSSEDGQAKQDSRRDRQYRHVRFESPTSQFSAE